MTKKILGNSAVLFSSQILARLVGFAYFVFLARNLTVKQLGIYVWVLGFVYNFYPLADFGLQRLTVRDLARSPQKEKVFLRKAFPFSFFLSLFSLFLVLTTGVILGVGREKLFYLFVFALTIIPYNLLFLYAAAKNAAEKMGFYGLLTILISLLNFGGGYLVIHWRKELVFLFLSQVLILFFLALFLLIKEKAFSWKIKIDFWREILREIWPIGVISTLAVFYLRVGLLSVGWLLGDFWAGIYGVASKFIEAGILLPSSVALAFFPLTSRLVKEDKEKMRNVYRKGVFLLFLLSLPVGGVMFFGGKWIIPMLYGERYLPAVPIFSLMGVLMVLFFVNSLAGNVIQSSSYLKNFVPFAFLNFLVAVVSCWWLITKIGAIGGVWGMIISEIFGLIVNNIFVWRILKSP